MAKEFGSKRSQTLVYLLGFTLAYQALYQYIMWSHLPKTETKPLCWGTRDSEERSTADQCPENELFMSWDALSHHKDFPYGSDLDEELHDPMELLVVNPAGHVLQLGNSSSESPVLPQTPLPAEANAVGAPPAVTEAAETTDARMRSLGSVARALASSATERERPLLARIQDLQREMCVDPHRREHRSCQVLMAEPLASEKSANFSAPVDTTLNPVTHEGTQQVIAGELVTVKHKVQHAAIKSSAQAHVKNTSQWIDDLSVAQAKMEAYMRSLHARNEMHSLRTRAHGKSMKGAAEKVFVNFRRQVKALEAGLAKIDHERTDWENSLASRALAVGLELCAEPQRQGNPACNFFLKQTPSANNDTAATTITTQHRVLKMPALEGASKSKTFLGRREDTVHIVTAKDLQDARWSGRIPKVACIMAIPMKRQAGAELRLTYEVKHAIEGFRAQEYEGPRQLIIVHHFQDRQAAALARKFADGFYIKAVAARSDVPSTTSLRYGAWASDADAEIVARWDMDAWHHPKRLAMQVRALGLTGRPACQLKEWTFVGNTGDKTAVSSGAAQGGSLMGQRTWMEKHWHPLLPEESREVAAEDALGFVAQLDAPEMLAYGPGAEAWRRVLW